MKQFKDCKITIQKNHLLKTKEMNAEGNLEVEALPGLIVKEKGLQYLGIYSQGEV